MEYGMRAFEQQPGEPDRAFNAYKIYREMDPNERSLREVAAELSGDEGYRDGTKEAPGHIRRWSSEHDWVGRARSYHDYHEMMRRTHIEEYMRSRDHAFAERKIRVQDQNLKNAEAAAEQCAKMLEWPLTEQRIVRNEDGEDVTYVFTPAGWNKATARVMFEMASQAVASGWSSADPMAEEEVDEELDLSEFSEQNLEDYLELANRMGIRRPDEEERPDNRPNW